MVVGSSTTYKDCLPFVEGLTKNTFTAMFEGIRNDALAAGIIDQIIFDKGIQDLYRTAKADDAFVICFSKLSEQNHKPPNQRFKMDWRNLMES